jgi:hypothetical protein
MTDRLGPVTRTNRGFEIVEFRDINEVPCSLQASSLAIYEQPGTSAVWLGCEDAAPRVLMNGAWQAVPMPHGYSVNTRMHLSREQVAALILHLQAWLEHDTFAVEG